MEKYIEKTLASLRKNNMSAYYCKTKKEALELIKELLTEGQTIASGGSVTLNEIGIIDYLKNGRYNYLDRNSCKSPDEADKLMHDSFNADVYLSSANAITINGELYNVDGNSNRVAAIAYGPKSVIIAAGKNKIVPSLDEAIHRVKTIAAPKNTLRLNMNTYCQSAGECSSLKSQDSEMCDGCFSDRRICCTYMVSAFQRKKDRIKVIIIDEPLGY